MKVKRYLTLVLALQALGLSGCAGFPSCFSDRNEMSHEAQPVPPAEKNIADNRIYEDGPGLLFPLSDTAEEPVNLSGMIDNQDVEIFSLDGPIAGSRALPATEGGVPALTDQDVTVYPFEDVPNGAWGSERPSLRPPSDERRAFPSPFKQSEDRSVFPSPFPAKADKVTPFRAPVADKSEEPENVVYFAHDSASLDKSSRRLLTSVADDASDSTREIIVEGHASKVADANDPKEKDIINLKKSMDRAYNVSRALIRQGVPADKITTCAFGDTEPPRNLDSMNENAASRRVEIHTE